LNSQEGETGDRARDTETQNEPELQHKAVLRDYIETILICVVFLIFARAFVFQQSKIPSGSMMDTLLKGDYIMVNRFVYAGQSFGWESKLLPIRPVKRGDVVVFKWPPEPEVDYIKRVVGLPGDTVLVRDGYVYVNGKRVDEPYVENAYRIGNRNEQEITVASGHFFVMGDHRNASQDSRVWGQVPRELMKGRALLIWWSFDEDSEGGGPYPNVKQRLKSWGNKLIHFFSRTRWSRCFSLIR
jgi:signal peptidase I